MEWIEHALLQLIWIAGQAAVTKIFKVAPLYLRLMSGCSSSSDPSFAKLFFPNIKIVPKIEFFAGANTKGTASIGPMQRAQIMKNSDKKEEYPILYVTQNLGLQRMIPTDFTMTFVL